MEIALTLNNLGLFYKTLGRLTEARDSYLRALPIFQAEFGGSHPNVGDLLYNVSQLLKKESEAFEKRARLIQEAAEELGEPPQLHGQYASFGLRVAPSRIHRFGVFTAEAIPAGADIIEYTGERVTRREWRKRCVERTYLLRLNKYWCLDGSVGGSGAELINHCCEPNCKFRIEGDRAWVAATQPIEAGAELLLDYNFPRDCGITPCYCGAPSCRGTINRRA